MRIKFSRTLLACLVALTCTAVAASPYVARSGIGSLVAILSAMWIAQAMGVEGAAVLSLAPKSTTAPVGPR